MKSLNYNFSSVSNMYKRERFFLMIEKLGALPAMRSISLSLNIDSDSLHDRLAAFPSFRMVRLDNQDSLLESDTELIDVTCMNRDHYVAMHFTVTAQSASKADDVKERLTRLFKDVMFSKPCFMVDWYYATAEGIRSTKIEEQLNGTLLDAAYPTITEGVNSFIDRYLSTDLPVLVVYGPPGTGKTRLIRGILAEISRRQKDDCRVMFTTDEAILGRDEFFMRFVGSGHHALVIEDADHLLKPRTDGNRIMHRFLTVSDGIVRAQGRKIIFSSNLPNLGDLDDALIRPGRCFACVPLPRLSFGQVDSLIPALKLTEENAVHVRDQLQSAGGKSASLAEVYGKVMESTRRNASLNLTANKF